MAVGRGDSEQGCMYRQPGVCSGSGALTYGILSYLREWYRCGLWAVSFQTLIMERLSGGPVVVKCGLTGWVSRSLMCRVCSGRRLKKHPCLGIEKTAMVVVSSYG